MFGGQLYIVLRSLRLLWNKDWWKQEASGSSIRKLPLGSGKRVRMLGFRWEEQIGDGAKRWTWEDSRMGVTGVTEEGPRTTPTHPVCAIRWVMRSPTEVGRGLHLSGQQCWHHSDSSLPWHDCCSEVVEPSSSYSWGVSVCPAAWNPLPELRPRMLAHVPGLLPVLVVGPASLTSNFW